MLWFPRLALNLCSIHGRGLMAQFRAFYKGFIMFDPCWYIVTSRKAGRRFKAYMKRLDASPLAVGCWKLHFPNMESQTAFANSVKNYVADGGVVEMFPLTDWEFGCSRFVVRARG